MEQIEYSLKPRESEDDPISLQSTSLHTADASPIILKASDMIQTSFEPTIVDNPKEPEKAVSGKLIYEKKRKNDSEFPSKLSRSSIKVGEQMEIRLDTTETYRLMQGLSELYNLHKDLGQTPSGSSTYAKVDYNFRQLQSIIQNDPTFARNLRQSEVLDLVKLLLGIIAQTGSTEAVREGLKSLEQSTVSSLTNAINTARLEEVLKTLTENIENNDEEFWQKTFAEDQWILSQLFSCPYTVFDQKAYVGGKGISNTGGNVCDFIFKNNLTNNVALVEIKTPCAQIFGQQYRQTYSFSADMSGAINQVLNYRDKLAKGYYVLCHNSSSPFEAFSPQCYVIIGKAAGLNGDQIAALENYRNTISNVTIITFDEVVQRIRDMVELFGSDNPVVQAEPRESPYDEDIPF